MKGSLPRPFSPTDAKRDREEKARLAERGDGSLWVASGKTVAHINYTNAELTAALAETAATLTAADATIAAAVAETDAARAELAAALTVSDEAQALLAADMGTLQATTLPALTTDLNVAKGRLTTAETELNTAFEQLGTVDTRIGTAETSAINTAATTAQTKADAAAAEAKRQLDLAMASGASLIINGGFESGDVWPVTANQLYDTTEKRSGARSMKLIPAAGNVWPTNVWFDGATGRTYRCEFWIKRAGTTSVGLAVGAVFQAKTTAGATGTPIGYPTPAMSSLDISSTAYTKITVDHTILTADAVQVRIAPWVRTAAGNTYWVDDVVAYDITDAKAALDAATAAATAATAASGKAGDAQGTADAALNAATHTGKNLFGTTPPTGSAPFGTVWMQKGTGDVIIGQWQQTGGSAPNATTGLGGVDGSTWTKRDIDNQMIANLDVGKLTANTAAVNEVVAQKIAAATASIQQADIGNLTVTGTSKLADLVAQQVAADSGKFISLAVSQLTAGTASMGVGVIDKIYAEVVNSRKIIADQILLGNGANLHPDPRFVDPGGWNNPQYITAGAGRNGGNGLVIPASVTQLGSYYGFTDKTRQAGITPGQLSYRISAYVKGSGIIPAGGAAIYPRWTNPASSASGTGATPSTASNAASIAANTWTLVEGVVTVGATAESLYIGLYKQATANVQMTWSEPTIQPMVTSSLVAAGAILAPHITASVEMSAKLGSFLKVNAGMLEAQLVLATQIVSGNPTGQHARMDPTGFRAFAAPTASGEAPREVVRFGVAGTDDNVAVSNAAGETVASINATGRIAGKEVHAANSLTYQGRELDTLIDASSSKVIGYGARYDNPGVSDNRTGWGIMEISVPLRGGRLYRIATNNILMTVSDLTGILAHLEVRYTYSATGVPAAPTVSTGTLLTYVREAIVYGGNNSMKVEKLLIAPAGNYRFLLLFKRWEGSAIVGPAGSADTPIEMYIEDMGPATPNLMIATSGGGIQFAGNTVTPPPAAPAAQPRELEASAVALQTYTANGAKYIWAGADGKMFQGASPGGAGWLRSVAMFNDLTPFLSGGTITGMQAYFYFDHWYDNAGGTASIAVHGVAGTTTPVTYPGGTAAVLSSNWPKPGGRWVDIPSNLWNGFQTGQYRGLILEAPNVVSSYGSATAAKLFFKYNK